MLVLRIESNFYRISDDYKKEPSNASYLGLALIADQYDAYIGNDANSFDETDIYDKITILTNAKYRIQVITHLNRKRSFLTNNINEVIEAYQLGKKLTRNLVKEEEHTILINDKDIEEYSTKRSNLSYDILDTNDEEFGDYIREYMSPIQEYGYFSYEGLWCRSLNKINPFEMMALLIYDKSANYKTLYSFKNFDTKMNSLINMTNGYTKIQLTIYDTNNDIIVYITNKDYIPFLNILYNLRPDIEIYRFGIPLERMKGKFSFIKAGIPSYIRYINLFYYTNVTPIQYLAIVSCIRNLDANITIADNPSYEDLTEKKRINYNIKYDNEAKIEVKSSSIKKNNRSYYNVIMELDLSLKLKYEFIQAYSTMLNFIKNLPEQNTSTMSNRIRIRNDQNINQVLVDNINIKSIENLFFFNFEAIGISDEYVGHEIYNYYANKFPSPIRWDDLSPIWSGINIESSENWYDPALSNLFLIYHDKWKFDDDEDMFFNHVIKNKTIDYVNGLIFVYNTFGFYIINSERALFITNEDSLDTLEIENIILEDGLKIMYNRDYFNAFLKHYPRYLPPNPKYTVESDIGIYYINDKDEFKKGIKTSLRFLRRYKEDVTIKKIVYNEI